MMESDLEGGCQCGAIRYRVTGEPLLAAICHCTMCRRANAAPTVAWAMFQESQVAFLKGRPTSYASSPEAKARIVQMLVERVDVHEDALEVRIRAEELVSLVAELRQHDERRAA